MSELHMWRARHHGLARPTFTHHTSVWLKEHPQLIRLLFDIERCLFFLSFGQATSHKGRSWQILQKNDTTQQKDPNTDTLCRSCLLQWEFCQSRDLVTHDWKPSFLKEWLPFRAKLTRPRKHCKVFQDVLVFWIMYLKYLLKLPLFTFKVAVLQHWTKIRISVCKSPRCGHSSWQQYSCLTSWSSSRSVSLWYGRRRQIW